MYQAMNIVAMSNQTKYHLRKELVKYMLDLDPLRWSMHCNKENFVHIVFVPYRLIAKSKWFDDIWNLKNPVIIVLIYILFFILVSYPKLIISTIFLYMFLTGVHRIKILKNKIQMHKQTSILN